MVLPFLTLRRRAAKAYFAILRKQRCAEILLSSRGEEYPPYEPPSFSWACRAHTRPGLSESPRTPLTAKACGPGPVFAFVLRSAAGQIRRLTDLPSCLAPEGDARTKSRAGAPPLPPRREFRLDSFAENLRVLSLTVACHLGGSPLGETVRDLLVIDVAQARSASSRRLRNTNGAKRRGEGGRGIFGGADQGALRTKPTASMCACVISAQTAIRRMRQHSGRIFRRHLVAFAIRPAQSAESEGWKRSRQG